MNVQKRGFTLVLSGLAQVDEQVLQGAERGLARGLQIAVGISQREYLQGPRPQRLGEITTRLWQSITSRVERQGDSIRGMIGTNIPYARFHELGFTGEVQVRAHTRTLAEFGRVKVGGREQVVPVDTRKPIIKGGVIVGYKTSRTKAAAKAGTETVTQQVRAHTRHLKYAGRPFLAPALERALPVIINEIQDEVNK